MPQSSALNLDPAGGTRDTTDRFLIAGTTLLDLKENDLSSILERVLDAMVANGEVPSEAREAIIRNLMSRNVVHNERYIFFLQESHNGGLFGHIYKSD